MSTYKIVYTNGSKSKDGTAYFGDVIINIFVLDSSIIYNNNALKRKHGMNHIIQQTF